jgi:hypothetical protein
MHLQQPIAAFGGRKINRDGQDGQDLKAERMSQQY